MDVQESTLKQLIEGEKQFQVPLYQRRYSWQRPELSQLWSDILEQYDLLTPDDSNMVSTSAPTHFIGSIVLSPAPLLVAGVTPVLVIDGQQRLTTLMLALAALRDHHAASDAKAVERYNDRYLINKYGNERTRYRLLPTQEDRKAFLACVDSADPVADPGGVGPAYAFFRAQLSQLGPDNEPFDLERLEMVISQRLQFVVITAGPGDNVHRIFESLNDRGVQLSQSDLLRNYVFMLLPTRADHVYRNTWLPMQQTMSADELETLVFVDLILRGNTSVKRQDIYRGQQARLGLLQGNEAAVEAEVVELARRAKLFVSILRPAVDEDPRIVACLRRLHRWGATTVYPLLLHAFDRRSREACDSDEVYEALSYVESFLIRRMIAGVATNNLNRVFSQIISQLDPNVPLGEAVRTALSETRKYWPSDQRLREAVRSTPFYFQGRQEQKMLVFQRLEESYGHGEPIDWAASKLSIEHIMPQSLSDAWRADLSAAGDVPEDVHSELLHTLGNLTITAYNGELSNNPFDRKKQILQDSHLDLNRDVAPHGRWARAEILARADQIANQAIAIWPAPLPGVEPSPSGRDWSELHAALAAMPRGSWTSYTDAAELIGSYQVPVGQHLATSPGVLNAHRVLGADGRVSPSFHWVDPSDERDIHDVLRSEGVLFDEQLVASPAGRLGAADLAALIGRADDTGGGNALSAAGVMERSLRFLRSFYEAPDGRLHETAVREAATRAGYDMRGTAGYYQGTASLRVDGKYRVLTEAGRSWYELNRHRLRGG